MCIICVSKKGVRQPSYEELKNMFGNNEDGAGYMCLKNNQVIISKGFMSLEELNKALEIEKFTSKDVVIYHFRKSTQGGVQRELTHPFPLSSNMKNLKKLDLACDCGIVHNGIIAMTSNPKITDYNDTMKFITDYMSKLIRNSNDLKSLEVQEMILKLTSSKWAFLDKFGNVETIGNFITDKESGLMFSNSTYKNYEDIFNYNIRNYNYYKDKKWF